MGTFFAIAIIIGLAAGLLPGLTGLFFIIRAFIKRRDPALVFLYLAAVVLVNIILIYTGGLIWHCGGNGALSGAEEMNDCFIYYIFFGSTFGLSLLAGLVVLFYKGRLRK